VCVRVRVCVCVKACRGNELDDGMEESDAESDSPQAPAQRIPIEADFLYAYSTTPGLLLWLSAISLCHLQPKVAQIR